MHTLLDSLSKCDNNRTRGKALEVIRLICRNHEGNRDLFEPGGMQTLAQLLDSQKDDATLVSRILRLAHRVCTKAENNKVQVIRDIGPDLIIQYLSSNNPGITRHTCLLMRGITNPDDLRREISCALENGRALVSRGAVPLLVGIARGALQAATASESASEDETDGTKHTDVASAAFLALRQLAITSESVNLISAHGMLLIVFVYLLILCVDARWVGFAEINARQ